MVPGPHLARAVCEHMTSPACKLVTLEIENCNVTSDVVKEAAQFLETNTTLQTLSFAHNDIGNIGAKILGQLLAKNSTLTALSLACVFQAPLTTTTTTSKTSKQTNRQQGGRNRHRQDGAHAFPQYNAAQARALSFVPATAHNNKPSTEQ